MGCSRLSSWLNAFVLTLAAPMNLLFPLSKRLRDYALGRGRYQESDWERREERREQERGEGLSEWELSENSGVSEQELSRLKTTTPQRVFYLVVGIALLVLLIVGILGANVFHFW
jgi:hypothetical protein